MLDREDRGSMAEREDRKRDENVKEVAPAAGVDPKPDDATAGDQSPKPVKAAKSRTFRQVLIGIAYVNASFNNTVVTITDPSGNVLAWSSAGRAGFKGSRKSTAFAAGVVGQEAARQAMASGMREIEVRIQGPGAGRETAVRALQTAGLNISVIKDITPVPHNGCRARKRRRV